MKEIVKEPCKSLLVCAIPSACFDSPHYRRRAFDIAQYYISGRKKQETTSVFIKLMMLVIYKKIKNQPHG
jgi:hypothetical protein